MQLNGTAVMDRPTAVTPNPSLVVTTNLLAEEAVAALASYTLIFTSDAARADATPEEIQDELNWIVSEWGMGTIRRAAADLPDWERDGDPDDVAFIGWCRQQVTALADKRAA
jgi:hypothetical protein